MDDHEFERLCDDLAHPRGSIRRAAIERIAPKRGGGIALLIDDPRVIPLLRRALNDRDRIVQRAAARALRPFCAAMPGLFDAILPEYAGHAFDGRYTHTGLLDTRSGVIWIPRFAALSGHASLVADGNADRYLRFSFYIPHQVPRRFRTPESPATSPETPLCGHLALHLVPSWSYDTQRLIPEWDERKRALNRRRQLHLGDRVVAFYRRCALPYPVRIHYVIEGEGPRAIIQRDVAYIEATAATS